MKVTFQSQAARDEVLKAFIRTKNKMKPDDKRISNTISVRKDLTVAERKVNEALYNEWKAKCEESKRTGDGKLWKRIKGKVVEVVPPPGAVGGVHVGEEGDPA